ncbi:MAG: hypothetical protein IKP38_08865 [Clostridia bacterium]|nr:hypothetical protein [Clostridia bacterium]
MKKRTITIIISAILAIVISVLVIVIIKDAVRKHKIAENLSGNTYTYVDTYTSSEFGEAHLHMECYRFEYDGSVTDYSLYKTMYDKTMHPYREDEQNEYTHSSSYSIKLKGEKVYIIIGGVKHNAEMTGDTVVALTYGPLRYSKSIGTF